MKPISFERVKKLALDSLYAVTFLRKDAELTVAVVKKYLDDGTILASHRGWDPKAPSVYNIMRGRVVEFIKGCDVRCISELLELFPKGAVRGLPGWLYDGVVAYMDDESGEWMLEPKGVTA